jgi:hypothetical protein
MRQVGLDNKLFPGNVRTTKNQYDDNTKYLQYSVRNKNYSQVRQQVAWEFLHAHFFSTINYHFRWLGS